MSKNNDKNNSQPLDDLGIKNDQIINCAEKIVDELWIRLHNPSSKDINATDMHAYSATLCNVWSLVKNMMEFLEENYDDEMANMTGSDISPMDDDDDDDDDDDFDDDDDLEADVDGKK
jgi:hypothetical protein